jgi:hypothetical protein
MKIEPRTDLSAGKPQVASDMPARRPPVAPRPVVASNLVTEEDVAPIMRRRSKFKFLRGNSRWVAACGLCALIGSMLGALATTSITQARVDRAHERMLLADSLDRLVELGVNIEGPTALPATLPTYAFPTIDLSDVSTTRDMRKAVRIAGTLPGVQSVNFCPAFNQVTRAGIVDETVLRVVGDHFPVLDTLDLSCSSVVDFRGLEGATIRHLKIVNAPLILESFTSLRFINGISELSLGWPDRTIPKDSMVRADSFRKALVEVLAGIGSLKKLNLYDIVLEKEEREKLSRLEITTARLGE